MATLSIPLTKNLEEFIEMEVRLGRSENKASVVRRALRLLAEEEAVASVLKADQEIREGKVFSGDLKKLSRKFSR
ncbi:MAG: hypothetical protein COV08_01610 [Candidatus Vogelbacteria bacterium CG10_big_fil_rev_8_21_14_0_10_49_38]|uniref:Ribbon-helix-helix protein CopG domain-containing protein n=1 Tax=Candidatus Vogelbacteria bacterium CG10_big_fil_rev_8_21_14_0_10_49_38 TaxID=1975043 RepID=A0A2H0RK07_9BACT|nr:MAG: hypothetical protein BK006_01625 [bacterium CG10_49_38]PIR46095.1 MAG: hypothetical protein COV08_01610 [Candidatus Vogelbacteria bacterium CG10_big_fil_rev_8_21_14_0_10_49_38]